MLATRRNLSLVSALVALTLFVIMEPSVVSSYSAYINADSYASLQAVMEKYHARKQEIATKYADKGTTTPRPISRFDLLAEMDTNNASSPVNIDATRLYEEESGSSPMQAHRQIRDAQMYYDDYYYSPYNGNGDGSSLQSKITQGDCHTGRLRYQQSLNLEVWRSSFSTVDISLPSDESYCITCVSMKAVNRFRSTFSCTATSQSTIKLTATGSWYEYREELTIMVKVFQIRKRGRYCD